MSKENSCFQFMYLLSVQHQVQAHAIEIRIIEAVNDLHSTEQLGVRLAGWVMRLASTSCQPEARSTLRCLASEHQISATEAVAGSYLRHDEPQGPELRSPACLLKRHKELFADSWQQVIPPFASQSCCCEAAGLPLKHAAESALAWFCLTRSKIPAKGPEAVARRSRR